MSGLQKKKLYHGLHKRAPQSTGRQSMQISQRWSQKFSSNSVLSICKRISFFCFVLQFIRVITCGEKKNTWTCNTVWPIPKKKATNNNNKKRRKNNYSNNNNRELNTNFWNIAVKCCSLLLFIFTAVFTEKISPEVVKETHMPRSSENEIFLGRYWTKP